MSYYIMTAQAKQYLKEIKDYIARKTQQQQDVLFRHSGSNASL